MSENNDVQMTKQPTSLTERVQSLRLPGSQPAARAPRRAAWLPWTLCVLLGVTAAALGVKAFSQSSADAARAGENKDSASTTASSSIHTASSGQVVLENKGNVVPVHLIQVSPKVAGLILDLHIRDEKGHVVKNERGEDVVLVEGIRVKEDWVLATLEDVEYRTNYDHIRASLAEAQQNLAVLTDFRQVEIDQAKAKWEEATAQRKQLGLDRIRSSRLRGSSLAERDYEQADSAYLAMVNHEKSLRIDYELLQHGPRDRQIAAARRRVEQCKADYDKAKWQLDNCVVRAPTTGTILTKKAEKGNIINPIAFNISASLCEMADLSDLEIDLSIQERDIAKVKKGQQCRIVPEAFPDRLYDGYVSRLMPQADRAKGAVPVRVKVIVPKDEIQGSYLKPEMGAIVSFLKPEDKK
jgi:multidrug efflux pump subunit AcrA (membrane-fusion protein)